MSCTFCHDRVVHGPKWLYTGVTSEAKQKQLVVGTAYAFTPTMETCYKCPARPIGADRAGDVPALPQGGRLYEVPRLPDAAS